MTVEGRELFRLAKEMRVAAQRIQDDGDDTELVTGLQEWASRLAAAAQLRGGLALIEQVEDARGRVGQSGQTDAAGL